MRRLIASIAATAAILAVTSPSASGANKVVDVGDDFFGPAELSIKENKIIDFNWIGVNDHNVFLNDGPGRYFDSGVYSTSGINFSKKFKKPGRYLLGCILHPDMDLNLKVKKRRR